MVNVYVNGKGIVHTQRLCYRKPIGHPLQPLVETVFLIPHLAFWGRALVEVLSLTCLTRQLTHSLRLGSLTTCLSDQTGRPAENQMGSHVIECYGGAMARAAPACVLCARAHYSYLWLRISLLNEPSTVGNTQVYPPDYNT